MNYWVDSDGDGKLGEADYYGKVPASMQWHFDDLK